jgi:hypothetical protein
MLKAPNQAGFAVFRKSLTVNQPSNGGVSGFQQRLLCPVEMCREGWPFISRICRYNATLRADC